MCAVHGPLARCRCGYARNVYAALLGLALGGCALVQSVTPADRATAYGAEAATARAECKAYKFDRATGLVADVPAMTALCAGE